MDMCRLVFKEAWLLLKTVLVALPLCHDFRRCWTVTVAVNISAPASLPSLPHVPSLLRMLCCEDNCLLKLLQKLGIKKSSMHKLELG